MKQKSSTTGKSQIVHRAYKTELKLNNRQRTLCYKHAGCARFAFYWGLQRKIEEYARTGKSPSSMDLHRELNKRKKTEFPWMYEVSKCAPQEALRNLDNAFRHFFNRLKRGEKPGFPKFKSRKRGVRSFRLTGVIRVFNDSIQLPRLGVFAAVAVSSTETLNAWHEAGGYSLRAVPVNDAGTEHRISSCKFRGTESL
ncbi:MAG: RNA-guided endonuclease InsQ/TnpB family protein [Candidatus Odinarchaeota archaeon]